MKNTYFPAYELKSEARTAMRGNFLKILYACAMPVIFAGALTALILKLLPGASDSIQLVLRGSFSSIAQQQDYLLDVMDLMSTSFQLVTALLYFLRIGGIFMILSLLRGKKTGYKKLFAFFPGWFSAAVYSLALFAVSLLLGIAQSAAAGLLGDGAAASGAVSLLFMLISLFVSLKFSFTPYILADCGCKKPLSAMKKSWQMASVGTMCNIIALSFSFIGWIFLSLFTMGAGLLYVLPYMETSLAALYGRIKPSEGYNF